MYKLNEIDYKGYKIEVYNHDSGLDDAFGDCMVPIILGGNNRVIEGDYFGDNITDELLGLIKPGQVYHVIKALGLLHEWREFCEYNDAYKNDPDYIPDFLDQYFDYKGDYFDALETIAKTLKIPAKSFYLHGSSQSDWQYCFMVYLPSYAERMGTTVKDALKKDWLNSYYKQLNLYWQHGACGFSVTKDDELLDSCGGYIVDPYDDNNWMVKEVKADIDRLLLDQEKQRISKLKGMIKANTPLHYREAAQHGNF